MVHERGIIASEWVHIKKKEKKKTFSEGLMLKNESRYGPKSSGGIYSH